jgi:hypothetical protein
MGRGAAFLVGILGIEGRGVRRGEGRREARGEGLHPSLGYYAPSGLDASLGYYASRGEGRRFGARGYTPRWGIAPLQGWTPRWNITHRGARGGASGRGATPLAGVLRPFRAGPGSRPRVANPELDA